MPGKNRVWFQYLSHKVARLVVPLCLLLVLVSSAVLREGVYAAALGLQLLWYGVAACAGIPRLHRLAERAVSAATALAALNLAVVLGLAYIAAGRRDLWRRPAPRPEHPTAARSPDVSGSADRSSSWVSR
jgi:hypothetical protein